MVKITSTLNSGLEGWYSEGDGSKYAWSSTFGDGSGGIKYTETATNWDKDSDYIVAPNEFLGDISSFKFFRFQTNVSAFDAPAGFFVAITGSNGITLRQFYSPTQTNTWETQEINLQDPTAWVNAATGTAPDQSTLTATLGDVTKLIISLDGKSGTDNNTVYLDDPRLVCFTQDTMILTQQGERAIQDLAVGDKIWTHDHGYQSIRWIASTNVAQEKLALFENLRPICFDVGSLGPGRPDRKLCVSPQHRMLVQSKTVDHTFRSPNVLVPAKHLCAHENIWRDDTLQPVTYYHILFDSHEIIQANGALSKSLFTGAEARKTIPDAAWQELVTLFPALANQSVARPIANRPKTANLLMRLKKNNRDLFLT